MTNDELADLLLKWPAGTPVSVLVDANMSVDIDAVTETEMWDSAQRKAIPAILIELPVADVSVVPPLTVPEKN